MVDSSGDELHETAQRQAGHEEDAATTDAGDYAAVYHDGDDADGDEDTAVHEGAADVCHLLLSQFWPA